MGLRHDRLTDLPPLSLPAQRSADRVHGDAEQVLSELLRSVERLQELLEELLDQAGLEKMGQAQEVADSLETEIKELKRRDTEMKDLARCEDHIHYLQVGRTKRFTEGWRWWRGTFLVRMSPLISNYPYFPPDVRVPVQSPGVRGPAQRGGQSRSFL